MRSIVTAMLLASITSPAVAKDAPPAPATMPDLAKVHETAERQIRASMFDPASTTIDWTSGFAWGSAEWGPFLSKHWGWKACANINSKNRLGGYVGARLYHVVVDPSGRILSIDYDTFCDTKTPVQPELMTMTPGGSATSVADEIGKLADLKAKGVLSQAEFDTQKARLLAR